MQSYINLLRKIAWSFHKTSGLEWDDLFSETIQSYYKAMEEYDPRKGKITTHITTHITLHMINYLKAVKEKNMESIDDTDLLYQPANNPSPFWEGLTKDANEIAKIVLASSQKFVCLDLNQVEERITNIMSCQGWSNKRIELALYDLKVACDYQFEN
jgi:DNA-directed RNA polymerase specialized sigma subunit